MKILSPMRPGIKLGNQIERGWALNGWAWQPKVNDERAVLRVVDGTLWNRHGQPFDRTKAMAFAPALESLRREFAGHDWLDLGLIGYREADAFKASRGAIVVFDVPSPDGDPWIARRDHLHRRLPALDLIAGDVPVPGMVYCFDDTSAAGELFHRTKGIPGLEGIVGRLLMGPYVQGEAQTMAKARWEKG